MYLYIYIYSQLEGNISHLTPLPFSARESHILLINNGVQLYSWKSWLTNASCGSASQVFALAVAGNPTGEALQGANLQIPLTNWLMC